MATFTGIAPIKQALVHYLRQSADLRSLATGGFHEGFAPSGTRYPFVIYQVQFAPEFYTWTSLTHDVGIVVSGWAENTVVADNLDEAIFRHLHDAELEVEGQSTLICRRISSLSLPGLDDEGKKVYQAGGIYELWTDQQLPERTSESDTFTADAVLA